MPTYAQIMQFTFLAVIALGVVYFGVRAFRSMPRRDDPQPHQNGASKIEVSVVSAAAQSPKCQVCQQAATHPMPIIGNAPVRWLWHLGFDVRAKERTVIDDPTQPNALCARDWRIVAHQHEASLLDERAEIARVEANTARSLALSEGGGAVEVAKKITAIGRDEAGAAADGYRRFAKPSQAPELTNGSKPRPEDQPS
jgi:hypothetical protein